MRNFFSFFIRNILFIGLIIYALICVNEPKVKPVLAEDSTLVYASGRLSGIYEKTDGILVMDVVEVKTKKGKTKAPAAGKICSGDYIVSANGTKISSKDELARAVNDSQGSQMEIEFIREGKKKEVGIKPAQSDDGKYYLGIWVKDDLAGIGTITCYSPDGKFVALGHGIGDGTTEDGLLSVSEGALYEMQLTDIKKGKKNEPGELGGVVYFGKNSHIGEVSSNRNVGINGQLDEEELNDYISEDKLYDIAGRYEVNEGDAVILSEISGEVEAYSIKILDVDCHPSDENKGLMIEITDEKLLKLTGGIVQGMSGSPIIQDGKIVGAVTHVFVDDPTRGYGIFIEDML